MGRSGDGRIVWPWAFFLHGVTGEWFAVGHLLLLHHKLVERLPVIQGFLARIGLGVAAAVFWGMRGRDSRIYC